MNSQNRRMEQIQLTPKQALNKGYLKVKPVRYEIENFKSNLSQLFSRINENETEEHHKNILTDFLKKTYYETNYYINTKGRNDLVIHNSSNPNSSVGVIIEVKKPHSKPEMLSNDNLNTKAFHELLLYYLRERIILKNLEIKQLIVTNVIEWFIFDATVFEKLFVANKVLVNLFLDFESGVLAGKTTDFFYKEIASPYIAHIKQEIEYTYFDIRNYEKLLKTTYLEEDIKLNPLFKIFSPVHLLKLPFANDSNSLNQNFYNELLHILGLTENKVKGKKLIERKASGERNLGTFIEDAVMQLESSDVIKHLPNANRFGKTTEERLFSIALELSITWINRILFLKLLEAQLLIYNNGDKKFAFLNLDSLKSYNDVNTLFFQVLARTPENRNEELKTKYKNIPYLNSSLFEPTETEYSTIFISNLKGDNTIPIIAKTVLKDNYGKKLSGKMSTLEYLFKFLDAYDFSSEGSEDIQEERKTLINASVLGLIFEKINGYREGSFFTPGFITMYMCRETIRNAVVQKFNDTNNWNCNNFSELKEDLLNQIRHDKRGRKEVRRQANSIINELKICDPAVGSGHFLVSALNELICIKSELNILVDKNFEPFNQYEVLVANDELVITNVDGDIFKYNFNNKESQRFQEALFHEKQTIIENCLFGVDINTNSVKICRLRLWIELLKNAYYKKENELETLPNIDINIKTGNSLISRFAIDSDLGYALKKSKWTIESYKNAVATYRNAHNKEQKWEMKKLIASIKADFKTEISKNDPKVKKLNRISSELYTLTIENQIFEKSDTEINDWNNKIAELAKEKAKLESELDEFSTRQVFDNAFEWRFEFPEVLNENGDFIGFDVIIGNPPYISSKDITSEQKEILMNYETAKSQYDLFSIFIEKSLMLLKNNSYSSLIVPDSFLARTSFKYVRELLHTKTKIISILQIDKVFPEASVSSCIYLLKNGKTKLNNEIIFTKSKSIDDYLDNDLETKKISFLTNEKINSFRLLFIDSKELNLLIKIFDNVTFEDNVFIWRGEEIGKRSDILCKKQSKENIKIVTGENISRYMFKNKFNYINVFDIEKNIKNYQKEKILIRQLGTSINANIDFSNAISTQSVYNLYSTSKDYPNLLLLAILNSKLVHFVYSLVISEKQQFPRILIENIKNLTLPPMNTSDTSNIIGIVKEILKIKENNPNANTLELENEIDQVIYKLYNLTKKEIAIIEQNYPR